MADLTKHENDEVAAAVQAARDGRATLVQLARAHSIAERGGPSDALGEIRDHIRVHVPGQPANVAVVKSLLMGVAAGIITNLLMNQRK